MVTLQDLNRDTFADAVPVDDPEVVSLTESGTIFESLSSDKRRAIMAELCAEPANAAEIANRIDTSVQNAIYHLTELREAGLVDVVGTHYSDRGLEMDIYAPTRTSIVIDVDGTGLENPETSAVVEALRSD